MTINDKFCLGDQASWIASLSNIGQLFGAVATGVLSGKFGRKPTLMILCAPLLAGWATIGEDLKKGIDIFGC